MVEPELVAFSASPKWHIESKVNQLFDVVKAVVLLVVYVFAHLYFFSF